MDLLGFGNRGLSDALFPRQHSNDLSFNRLRCFAADCHLHISNVAFTAGSLLQHIQSKRHSLQKLSSGSISASRTIGKDLHAYHTFKLLGGLQFSIGGLRSFSSCFRTPGKSKNNNIEGSPTTVALFGSATSGNKKSETRFWTNVLIGLNVLLFIAQEASHGKLLLLGAKINSLIDRGQVWRFLTPAFLHASFPHLLTNCYSLNSIGPVIEAQGGSARFLAVYFGSAVTGFFLSYSFTRAPAVGASGAVFGLVGSLAVFLLRHKDLLTGAQQSLSNLSRMIAINLVLGLATSKIDNWGHLGGLVGGAAISWLVGPSLSYRRIPGERKMVLVDRPPVAYLLPHTWKDSP